MIPYEELCRALDRHQRRQRGEQVEDEPAAMFAAEDDFGIEAEADIGLDDAEILDAADVGAYAEPEHLDVGDMTDRTDMPQGQADDVMTDKMPLVDPNAPAGGPGGTIYGMPAAPPPPPPGGRDPDAPK